MPALLQRLRSEPGYALAEGAAWRHCVAAGAVAERRGDGGGGRVGIGIGWVECSEEVAVAVVVVGGGGGGGVAAAA